MSTLSDYPMPLETLRSIWWTIKRMMTGGVNWCGNIHLANGATQTTKKDERVREGSQITFMAIDAAGQTALSNGVFVDNIVERQGTTIGSFRLNHTNPGAITTLRYSIKG